MRYWLSSLVLLSILLSTSCAVMEEPPQEEEEDKESYTKSSLEREIAPNISPEKIKILAQDNTAFALSFYNQIRQANDNIIFSPISLSVALSMAMAGAQSDTQAGMINALSFSLPEAEIYPTLNALLLVINKSEQKSMGDSEGNKFQLNIANSIWGQAGFTFHQDYLDLLARNFGTGIYTVNFSAQPEQAREAINQWVEDETQEKISDLISPGGINTLTRLVLANAIYFKGSWLHPFNKKETLKAPFYALDGSKLEVDMMHLGGERLAYAHGENYQAVNLPYYSSDFSMTIILPEQGAFNTFEEDLRAENLYAILNSLTSQRVDFRMPKFDYESTINANDPLISLGMSDAFNPDAANFSGITDEDELYITDVLHKATITVDEEGTEAAAATAVIMGIRSMEPGEPISLTIDRPFIYLIQHIPTGSILFFGRVTEP